MSEDREIALWTTDALKLYIDRSDGFLQEEVDRRFATIHRELGMVDDALKARLVELHERVGAGDERLREHVVAQVEQIRSALTSADQLEQARVDAVTAALEALRTLTAAQAGAQREAITKAEVAANDKFAAHNGLIEQMRQQAVKSEQTLAVLVGTLLPRETFDTWKQSVERQLSEGRGEKQGAGDVDQRRYGWNTQAIAVAAVIVAVLAIVATVVVNSLR